LSRAAASFHEVSGNKLPDDSTRICPLIGNSEIKLILDARGAMHDFTPSLEIGQGSWPAPRIVWAGRRHNRTSDRYNSNLFEWGFLDVALEGEQQLPPVNGWRQRIVPRQGLCETEIQRGNIIEKATSFVHLQENVIVFHRRFENLPQDHPRKLRATYTLSHVGTTHLPHLVNWQPQQPWNKGIAADTTAYGMRVYNGRIALFSDQPCTARSYRNRLEIEVPLNQAGECTVYLSFADDLGNDTQMVEVLDGNWESEYCKQVNRELRETRVVKPDPVQATNRLLQWVEHAGYSGVLQSHKRAWEDFFGGAKLQLPPNEEKLQAALDTQLYTLRTAWTPWSVPATPFNSAWGANYFWDERFGLEGLLALGMDELPERTIEWRRRCLPFSTMKLAGAGALYAQMATEAGSEASDRNIQHHFQFQVAGVIANYIYEYCRYKDDPQTWRRYFPVLFEIAEFHRNWMIIELPGNVVMTPPLAIEGPNPRQDERNVISGAARSMQVAADAAARLALDEPLAREWKRLADLVVLNIHRQIDGPNSFLDFELHEYHLPDVQLDPAMAQWRIDERKRLERPPEADNVAGEKAVEWVKKVWSWGFFTSAYECATTEQPEKALQQLRGGLNTMMDFASVNESCFEDFTLVKHPWFATAAGAYVRALARMLVRTTRSTIYVAPGVPAEWKQFAFEVPIHGAGRISVQTENGLFTRLSITETRPGTHRRIVHIPKRFLKSMGRLASAAVILEDTPRKLVVQIETSGTTELLSAR